MIDPVSLQMVRDVVTIFGVIAGLSYYVTNIREIRRNRRISLTTTMFQTFMTTEGTRKIVDLLSMEWDSIEDYMEKYDSKVNPENASKRMSMWVLCNTLGLLYREGYLDFKTLIASSGGYIGTLWLKFKPVIEEYRGTHYHETAYEDFEYLAELVIEHQREGGKRSFGIPDRALGGMVDEYQREQDKR